MLCEICQQREATIHTKHIVNGASSEHHLCSECAAKQQPNMFPKMTEFFPSGFFEDQGFSHWLQPMFQGGTAAKTQFKHQEISACPHCSMTWEEFQKNGLLGCPTCYEHFGEVLPAMLRRLHGATEHVGKKPHKMVPLTEKEKLEQAMQQAIKEENFEEAAKLRDAIKNFDATDDTREGGDA